MKNYLRILWLICALLCVPSSFSQLSDEASVYKPAASSNCSYTYCALLNDASTPADWTDANSPTWGSTTAPAPLAGFAKSLSLAGQTVTTTHSLGSEQSPACFYIEINVDSSFSFTDICMKFLDGSGATVGDLVINNGFIFGHNGSATTTTASASSATTYYIWYEQTKGTGANGTTSIYLSTTTTKPGSPSCTTVVGTATTGIKNPYVVGSGGAHRTVANDFIFNTSAIPGPH